jgi:hypothetical protein
MIRSKDRRQKELMDFIPWGTERHHKILKSSIYHTFRKDILPNIPIHFFAKHFSEEFGRPTKDLQSLVGLFILQALRDMTDLEAIEAYSFNDTNHGQRCVAEETQVMDQTESEDAQNAEQCRIDISKVTCQQDEAGQRKNNQPGTQDDGQPAYLSIS